MTAVQSTCDHSVILAPLRKSGNDMNEQATNVPEPPRRKRRWLLYLGVPFLVLICWQVVASVTDIVPTPVKAAAVVTDKVYEYVYSEDIKKRAAELPAEVNILIVGLDNRL